MTVTTSTAPYARKLGAARNAAAQARTAHTDAKKALETATQNATIRADFQEMFLARATTDQANADSYAKCLRAIADIVASLPTLRQAVETTEANIPAFDAAVTELEADACYHCDGSGLYGSYTSHLQGGLPLCWKCGGTGLKASARKAVNA